MIELFQNLDNTFFFEIFFIFLGIGVGFAISEYKEHKRAKKNLKNIKELILNDVSKISLLRLKDPPWPAKRRREYELRNARKFIESKGNLNSLTNYHRRFDLSFWKGLLQTGTPMEFEKDFFYSYMSFYQEVENRVNSMEIAYEETKRDIAIILNEYYDEKILEESTSGKETKEDPNKDIEDIVDEVLGPRKKVAKIGARERTENSIANELFYYYTSIHANFYAINHFRDKLPNPIKERLEHAFDSTSSNMKWNDLSTNLYLEGLKDYTEEKSENS